MMIRLFSVIAALGAMLGMSGAASAAQPYNWQLGFQPAVSPIAEQGQDFWQLLLIIISVITIFVFVLLVWIIVRFRRSVNPEPSRTSHNTLLEVAWTTIPMIILIVISTQSFSLIFNQAETVDADMTIKATGSQWYWTYEYPDHGNFVFDAVMIPDDDLQEGQLRLLETDTHVVVPVNTKIRLQVAANDVIHSWAVPALFVKMDAVPGRLNETWFEATQEGVYYGQCSELCGIYHAFMPIVVEVVSQDEFNTWVEAARVEYAVNPLEQRRFAQILDE